jgi:ABC-type transport system involved in multi-copper enzyme maturation permease subunit
MTAAIFWRFVWKEYRVMRAFWISMACLAVLAQLALVAFPGLTHYSTVWTFSFALIFPALYAVACGATMFAAEKEDGTYEFLRGLPVTAWRILTGKLAFAVASTLLLIAALWCLAAGLSRGSSVDAQLRPQLWGTYGLAAVEGLAWGMLFSLVLRRPLQAAVLAIAAASVAVHVALWRSMPFAGEGHVFELGQYLAVVPYRSMIAGAVLLVDGLLVRRWLRPDKRTARRSLAWWRRRVSTGVSAAAPAMPLSPRRSVILGRLVWQTWRQSRWTMAAMAGPGTLGAIFAIVEISTLSPSLLRNDVSFFAAIAVAASLMGACVFLSDNERRSVRFLADHGVRPRQVWFARELTWMAGLAAWAIVWRAIIGFLSNGNSAGHFGELIAIAIAGFACGQFASMLVPSGIVAAFVGVVLALVCAAWVGLI